MKSWGGRRWWSALAFAFAVIVIYKVVNNIEGVWSGAMRLLGVLTPFIGGLVIAFLLYKPSRALEDLCKKSRFRIVSRPARIWSLLGVYLMLAGVLALVVAVIVPVLVQGVTGLVAALPGYFEQAIAFLNGLDNLEGPLASLGVEDILQETMTFFKKFLTAENIFNYISGLVTVTSSFISVLIAFIISIYMLAGRESLLGTLSRLSNAFLPDRASRLLAKYSVKAANIFSRYIYSMLIDALCICIVTIPGLYISGIPYPLAFAVFIGVSNLIPYFGALISGSVAVLVVLLSGHWGMALFLAIYILVAQQLDGNILQPRIYGQSVGIKPLYVLLAITVGGGLGGFVGMLIGVPVMAVLQMLVSDLVQYRQRVKKERVAARAGLHADDPPPADAGDQGAAVSDGQNHSEA